MNRTPGRLAAFAAFAVAALIAAACATPTGPTPGPTPSPIAPSARVSPSSPAATASPSVPAPSRAPSPPVGIGLPTPTCGGARPTIAGALPCEAVASIALEALARAAPGRLSDGIAGIDVYLEACPAQDAPPEIDCTGEPLAQFVTVSFGSEGGPFESSLTVVVAPVSGRVLGISDELVL